MPHQDVELLDLADPSIAAAVLMLQQAAYRVEAELIDFDGIPPLHESLEDLVASPLHWIGIRAAGGELVAALANTTEGEMLDIDRLAVVPDRSRNGYGSALIGALDPGSTITVSTGSTNVPAHSFYAAQGFTKNREEEVVPGPMTTRFTREPEP
jgi:GNAT superfamily N-acetyltransferase